MHLLAFWRHGHRFVLMWGDESESTAEAMSTLLRWASDRDLPFTNDDAIELGAIVVRRWADSQARHNIEG